MPMLTTPSRSTIRDRNGAARREIRDGVFPIRRSGKHRAAKGASEADVKGGFSRGRKTAAALFLLQASFRDSESLGGPKGPKSHRVGSLQRDAGFIS